MSTPSARSAPPRPPEKGAFPLDHFGECEALGKEYVKCVRREKNVSFNCRDLAKKYLECRMETGLMAREGWDKLGFNPGDADIHVEKRPAPQPGTQHVPGLEKVQTYRK